MELFLSNTKKNKPKAKKYKANPNPPETKKNQRETRFPKVTPEPPSIVGGVINAYIYSALIGQQVCLFIAYPAYQIEDNIVVINNLLSQPNKKNPGLLVNFTGWTRGLIEVIRLPYIYIFDK